ncbi:glycosyltransferase family 2 protein [Brasilonema octagenarum UFV-E1]|uniref:Glycosyltransferase family 2 protein n=1 Tax=Brasilonema sennae CENA114 TaxID=415709 RepID=A0A856MA78_9CYAN|nr:glycosyltransferase family 2 protein [Brasilonema sennae]QDL07250.1 glycosyltransferase family 2 protein [Brasilonema sennae CENA114]QDL13613.1 glycosyltransferase family 2 protein [Brasilonema octagenarum UFV-E1]
MHNFQLKTPVAFLIFKRTESTERVFEAIRQAKPPKLLVIADGPRTDRPGEADKCAATRAIIDRVDWDCEVLKNYSDVNMGMKKREASGFDWVFETVEEAIILEDDTLPHPTFFRYCEELLHYYRHDERIMLISGNNFQFGRKRTEYSYYFSRYPNTWGWASWRRAWQHYDIEMKLWPKIRDGEWLKFILEEPKTVKFWFKKFQETYKEKISTWDYQWILTCWVNNGFSIVPDVNLVTNLGFGSEATNTKDSTSPFSNIPTQKICLPLQHPPFVIRHVQADYFIQKTHYQYQPNILWRAFNKSRKIINKMMK